MLTMQACSTPSAPSPALQLLAKAQPPAELAAACDNPVHLAGALNRGQVRALWAQDRVALVNCAGKHNAVVMFYRNLLARVGAIGK